MQAEFLGTSIHVIIYMRKQNRQLEIGRCLPLRRVKDRHASGLVDPIAPIPAKELCNPIMVTYS